MEQAKIGTNREWTFRQSLHRSIFRRNTPQNTAAVLAELLNVDESVLSKWCDPPEEVAREHGVARVPKQEEKNVPGKHLPGMAHAVRSGVMGDDWLQNLSGLAGGVFVPLPQVNHHSPALLSETMRQMSAVIDAHTTALEHDERFDAEEAATLRRVWNELVKRGESMVQHAEASARAHEQDARKLQAVPR